MWEIILNGLDPQGRRKPSLCGWDGGSSKGSDRTLVPWCVAGDFNTIRFTSERSKVPAKRDLYSILIAGYELIIWESSNRCQIYLVLVGASPRAALINFDNQLGDGKGCLYRPFSSACQKNIVCTEWRESPRPEAFSMKFFHSFWKLSTKIYLKCVRTSLKRCCPERQQLHFYSANTNEEAGLNISDGSVWSSFQDHC